MNPLDLKTMYMILLYNLYLTPLSKFLIIITKKKKKKKKREFTPTSYAKKEMVHS